jgi:hypothetical protein
MLFLKFAEELLQQPAAEAENRERTTETSPVHLNSTRLVRKEDLGERAALCRKVHGIDALLNCRTA